jgi:GTP cyclohydrolase I
LGLLRAFVALTSKSRHHLNGIGGDAEIVYLPDLGIKGNTHLLMLDLNNIRIADIVSKFLAEKALDSQRP